MSIERKGLIRVKTRETVAVAASLRFPTRPRVRVDSGINNSRSVRARTRKYRHEYRVGRSTRIAWKRYSKSDESRLIHSHEESTKNRTKDSSQILKIAIES